MSETLNKHLSQDILTAFLNAYWLRPEHALWFYYDSLEYERIIGQVDMSRSIDIGCGDGVTSFLYNGGRFPLDFDVYRSVDKTVSYNFDAAHDDYYDAFDPASFAQVPKICPPVRTFEFGVDHKKGLIRKAASLELYRNTMQHDFNKPMPFEAGRFSFIFSNTVYHATDVDAHLADLSRILDRDGRLCMYCPSSTFKKFALYRFHDKLGWDWIAHHDRGRYECWDRSATDVAGWTERFNKAGFTVEQHSAYLPFVVTMIEDIGLRAIFPSLERMAASVRKHDYQEYLDIKAHWIENLQFLLNPFKDLRWVEKAMPLEFVWYMFLLRKR